ncbi:MAG TPA: DUF4232 domain-containing protein [Streptosporangiaceae bacterium]|nr:DUF4232 domain-containing protein [Streptosporangiaceae bacterium]
MNPIPVPGRVIAAAVLGGAVLLAGCGSAAGPSARPTATVTVTFPAAADPIASPATSPTLPSQSPTAPASFAPSVSAAPSALPGCATGALTISLGSGTGAAGSSYYPIKFTNASAAACTLYGYPGVSFVAGSGAQVGAAATRDPAHPRQRVRLAPGETAHADLRVVNARNYPSATCDPVSVQRLKVYPPGQTSVLYLSLTATACRNPSVQILSVRTTLPGAGGAAS